MSGLFQADHSVGLHGQGIQAYTGNLSANVSAKTEGKIVSGVLNEDGSVDVPAGTTGRIIAFSSDPKTGGTVASTQINVTYGQ